MIRLSYVGVVFWILFLIPASAADYKTVTGAGGVPLKVIEWGNPDGQGILFIHGFQQSHLSWKRQFESDLGNDFHLVAFDLRAHGNSGKPWDVEQYTETKTWADDVHAVIEATGLDSPVLVAWSFGGVVLGDYIRHYGTADISGINIVGSDGYFVTRPPLDPSKQAQRAQQFARTISPNPEDNLAAANGMIDFLTAEPLDPKWRETVLAYNMAVPVYALEALTKRPLDNSDVAERITVPVLISWGAVDPVMTDTMADALSDVISSDVLTSRYEGIGHSPFYEDAQRFNRELREFVTGVTRDH